MLGGDLFFYENEEVGRLIMQEVNIIVKRMVALLIMIFVLPALSGCWYAAAAGAGAYVGYKGKEKGYKVQSPVTKPHPDKQEEEQK